MSRNSPDAVGGAPQARSPGEVQLLGVSIHCLRVDELFREVARLLRQEGRHLVTYVNVHTMNVAWRDPRLREAYDRSAITYCDGGGVVLGARLLGQSLPERMTSATFFDGFCRRWQDEGVGLFFLAGQPGVAAEACRRLKERYPRLRIQGHAHGYFARDAEEEERVISAIAEARPDILLVGFGTPAQERWVLAHWDRLEARIVWPIGALADYLSGRVPRCPQWMQRHNFEWLFRLLLEPRRMFVRYVVGNPLFVFRVLRQRVRGS